RHRAAVHRPGERGEPAGGREDLEEGGGVGGVDRGPHEARDRRRAGPEVVELGLEAPALPGLHAWGDQAQHLPVRPRPLVEGAPRPVGADRQVAHLQAVERDLGVTPLAQESAHAREVGNRARQGPSPPPTGCSSAVAPRRVPPSTPARRPPPARAARGGARQSVSGRNGPATTVVRRRSRRQSGPWASTAARKSGPPASPPPADTIRRRVRPGPTRRAVPGTTKPV